MKKLLLTVTLFIGIVAKSQVAVGSDSKLHSAVTGGAVTNLNEVSFVADTTNFKQGLSKIGKVIYYYNRSWKPLIDSTQVPYIDSLTSNLFNYNSAKLGMYQDNAGNISYNSGFGISDFMPVIVGLTYYIGNNGTNGSVGRFTTYYDSNKAVIAGGNNSGVTSFTIPSGVSYVKISFAVDQYNNTIYVTKSTTPSPYYTPYKGNNLKDYVKIDASNATFLTKSVNLFNPATATDGYYLSNTNAVSASSVYGISDFMPVEKGKIYSASNGLLNPTMRFTTYFDSAFNYVAGGSVNSVNGITVPSGVAYVRVTYDISNAVVPPVNKNTFQFQLGTSPTDFRQFKYNLITDANTYQDSCQDATWGSLNLKKWNAWKNTKDYHYNLLDVGDSYTDGNYFLKKLYDLFASMGIPIYGAGYTGLLQGWGPLNNYSIDSTKFKANWKQGSWTENVAAPNGTVNYSPNAVNITAVYDTSTITLSAGEAYDSVLVIYKKTVTSPGFSWKINAGGYTSVTTTSTPDSVGVLKIYTGGTTAPFTITLKTTLLGMDIAGIVPIKNGNLLTIHKVALTGSNASMFAQTPLFGQSIRVLSPSAIILMWGTNELNANIVPSIMKAYIKRIVNYFRGIDSSIDLLFMAPMATKYDGARAYRNRDYSNVMFQLAQEYKGAYIDFNKIFGAFSQNQINQQFMATDSVHPGAIGSWTYANAIVKAFAPNPVSSYVGYTNKTSTYSITNTDDVIDCNGTFTVTLPTAVNLPSKRFTIINSGTGTITVATTASQTINGVSTKALSVKYGGITVVPDGANYKVVASF